MVDQDTVRALYTLRFVRILLRIEHHPAANRVILAELTSPGARSSKTRCQRIKQQADREAIRNQRSHTKMHRGQECATMNAASLAELVRMADKLKPTLLADWDLCEP